MERGIFIITQENIINSGCFDFKNALEVTEEAVRQYSQGKVDYPDKISQIFDENTQDRINCLPATLFYEKVCGMKWVSVFPSNAAKGIQNLSASILLSSTENGFPLAFVEGTLCSNLRTASVSALAAKFLSPRNPKCIGFVGAGQQVKFHLMALYNLFPTIETCYVASRTMKSEQNFLAEMKELFPKLKIICCNSNFEMAVTQSDIFVSAISGQSPIIRSEWVKKGCLYIHVGGWEDEYSVAQKADKIVCDNWYSVKHRTQTISRMYKEGLLGDEDIYCNLDELVSLKKEGRKSGNEFIYFNAVGLSYVDIALANDMYKSCLRNGEGVQITLQNDDGIALYGKGEILK